MVGVTFYMIYVEGESSPTYRHHSLDSAIEEAKRLSKMLGKKAYILSTVMSVVVDEFKYEDLRESSDCSDDVLPF